MAARRQIPAAPAAPARAIAVAAATGNWAFAAEWALRRALAAADTLPAEHEREELQKWLQEALADTANPHVKAAWAYDLLVTAQHGRQPEERAEHLRVAKDVRDAVIICCILRVGTHSDAALFDQACAEAFGRQLYTYPQNGVQLSSYPGHQDSLYAQLHHAYQCLLKNVEGKFQSNSQLQKRRRPRRDKGADAANWEPAPEMSAGEDITNVAALGLRGLPFRASVESVLLFFAQNDVADRIADEPSSMQLLTNSAGRPSGHAVVQMRSRQDAEIARDSLNGQHLDSRRIEVFVHGGDDDAPVNDNELSSCSAAGQLLEAELHEAAGAAAAAAAAGHPAPRSSARSWGAFPTGAGTPGDDEGDEAAIAAPRVPADLEVPESLRRKVEDLLKFIVEPSVNSEEVVLGCLERLRCRLGEVEPSCLLSGPGQQLCCRLLKDLSGVIQRFPCWQNSQLHTTCVDVLLSMCVRRGDVLGLQAPGSSQEQSIKHLCPLAQHSVKEAIATAAQASSSDEAREEFTRLLVRTQPVSVVLETVDEEGTKVLLDEAKIALRWCFQDTESPGSIAFCQEVMKQRQDRTEFLSMHNWVQGGYFDSWYQMRDRFAVIGLLFGISAQILTPLSNVEDADMVTAALKALTLLDSISPFDRGTNSQVVQNIRELGGKDKREVWVGEAQYEVRAEYASVLGRLLQGSVCKCGSSMDAVHSYDMVDWTIREACDIIEHATQPTASDPQGVDRPIYSALWCLTQVFEGATSLEDWDEVVDNASRQAIQHVVHIQSKCARESMNAAMRLVNMRYGDPR